MFGETKTHTKVNIHGKEKTHFKKAELIFGW